MRSVRCLFWWCALLALAALPLAAQPVATHEIQVTLVDGSGRPISLEGWSCVLDISRPGGARARLEGTRATPRDGQLVEAGGSAGRLEIAFSLVERGTAGVVPAPTVECFRSPLPAAFSAAPLQLAVQVLLRDGGRHVIVKRFRHPTTEVPERLPDAQRWLAALHGRLSAAVADGRRDEAAQEAERLARAAVWLPLLEGVSDGNRDAVTRVSLALAAQAGALLEATTEKRDDRARQLAAEIGLQGDQLADQVVEAPPEEKEHRPTYAETLQRLRGRFVEATQRLTETASLNLAADACSQAFNDEMSRSVMGRPLTAQGVFDAAFDHYLVARQRFAEPREKHMRWLYEKAISDVFSRRMQYASDLGEPVAASVWFGVLLLQLERVRDVFAEEDDSAAVNYLLSGAQKMFDSRLRLVTFIEGTNVTEQYTRNLERVDLRFRVALNARNQRYHQLARNAARQLFDQSLVVRRRASD